MKREKIVQLIPSFPNDEISHYDGDDKRVVKDVRLYALMESGEIFALVRGYDGEGDAWILVDPPVHGYNMGFRYDGQKDLLDELDKTADKSDEPTTPE